MVVNFGEILHIVGLELEIFFVNMNLMLQYFFIMANYVMAIITFSVIDMGFSLLTLGNKVLAFYCFN